MFVVPAVGGGVGGTVADPQERVKATQDTKARRMRRSLAAPTDRGDQIAARVPVGQAQCREMENPIFSAAADIRSSYDAISTFCL